MTHQDQPNSDTNIAVLKDLFLRLVPGESPDASSRHGNAQYESHWLAVVAIVAWGWTLLGIWASLSLGKTTLKQAGQPISRISPVQVIRAFYKIVTAISFYATPKQMLLEQLAKALIADESGRTTSKKKPRPRQNVRQYS